MSLLSSQKSSSNLSVIQSEAIYTDNRDQTRIAVGVQILLPSTAFKSSLLVPVLDSPREDFRTEAIVKDQRDFGGRIFDSGGDCVGENQGFRRHSEGWVFSIEIGDYRVLQPKSRTLIRCDVGFFVFDKWISLFSNSGFWEIAESQKERHKETKETEIQRNRRGRGDDRHNLGVLPRRHLRRDGDRRTISHQIWTPLHLTRNFGGVLSQC
ncbi:hypothetical protein U1Q18_013934 [Sarracenia purpurea var. burkii]